MKPAIRHSPRTDFYIIAVYVLIVLAFCIASISRGLRVWGLNWWAYFSTPTLIILSLVGLAVVPVTILITRRLHSESSPEVGHTESVRSYAVKVGVLVIVAVSAFLVFCARTHFLGDGYQLLSRLAREDVFTKPWDAGASLLLYGIFNLLSGESLTRALQSFQIVSVASGALFVVSAAAFSWILFEDRLRRWLFLGGLVSGGYKLLFFGYVENYAPFILAVSIYALLCLCVLRGRCSRFWSLAPFAAACYFHIFGALLLPSLAYLLLRDTVVGKWVRSLSVRTRSMAVLFLAAVGAAAYYYLYTHYYFFTFALLPLLPDRFTIEHDTLFSLKHLTDLANLFLLLAPGLPVAVALALSDRTEGLKKRPEYVFLWILIAGTAGAVWIFNPGIGMPRNWDLFSVAGPPIVILCYFYTADKYRDAITLARAGILMIAASVLLLGGRVASQAIPEVGVAHFRDYLALDKLRNRNARTMLADYYKRAGDTAAVKAAEAEAVSDFPELDLYVQGRALQKEKKYTEAMAKYQRAMQIDPVYYDAYLYLGICYLEQGFPDQALYYLKISDGLNPYNSLTLYHIGSAYLRKNDFARAEKIMLDVIRLDSTQYPAMAALANVYLNTRQFDKSIKYFSGVFKYGKMPYHYFQQGGDSYVLQKAFPEASQAYRYALQLGLDSAYVRAQHAKYPELEW